MREDGGLPGPRAAQPVLNGVLLIRCTPLSLQRCTGNGGAGISGQSGLGGDHGGVQADLVDLFLLLDCDPADGEVSRQVRSKT